MTDPLNLSSVESRTKTTEKTTRLLAGYDRATKLVMHVWREKTIEKIHIEFRLLLFRTTRRLLSVPKKPKRPVTSVFQNW